MSQTTVQVPFAQVRQEWPSSDRLAPVRADAWDRFVETGLPSRREEDWKYTDVADIAKAAYRPAPERPLPEGGADRFHVEGTTEWVFLDGRPVTDAPALPVGARLRSLEEAAEDDHVAALLGQDVASPLWLLNNALVACGAVLQLDDNTRLDLPIHLIFLSSGGANGARFLHAPRTIVVAGKGSQAAIIETHASLEGGYFENGVTQLHLGNASRITHDVVQDHHVEADAIHTVRAWLGHSSRLDDTSFAVGAGRSRYDIVARMEDEGAQATLNGLYLGRGKQQLDHYTRVDHAKPHTVSRQLYKGVLDDESRGAFTGNVLVRPDAQKIESDQTNNNLLLSRKALAQSTPQLEILADDVVCSHGSTVGQLDNDALFFLQSRGIPAERARLLLTRGFAGEVLERLTFAPLREKLEARLKEWFQERGT